MATICAGGAPLGIISRALLPRSVLAAGCAPAPQLHPDAPAPSGEGRKCQDPASNMSAVIPAPSSACAEEEVHPCPPAPRLGYSQFQSSGLITQALQGNYMHRPLPNYWPAMAQSRPCSPEYTEPLSASDTQAVIPAHQDPALGTGGDRSCPVAPRLHCVSTPGIIIDDELATGCPLPDAKFDLKQFDMRSPKMSPIVNFEDEYGSFYSGETDALTRECDSPHTDY